jgi:ankyrin repeat protein
MNDLSLYELYKDLSQEELNNCLMTTCNYGELDKVCYLLTSSLSLHPNIDCVGGWPLSYACLNNHLDIVKYLLSSPELKIHADIHISNDHPLYCAITSGNIEVIKYLLSSPDLKDHADIHAKEDGMFSILCDDHEIEIITYLIFDYNIEKTSYIEAILNENQNEFKEQVKNMFTQRELARILEKDLSSDRINKKKTKL